MTIPRQSVRHIPLTHLVVNSANVRDDIGDVSELAASVYEHGILQPLIVTEHPTQFDLWVLLANDSPGKVTWRQHTH